MSTPSAAPPPAAKPKRRRARLLYIPVGLLAVVLIAFLIVYVRGTWADAEPRNPATVAEGPVSQLYETHETLLGTRETLDSRKVIRCAILLPYPVERVWAVVTDYPHYSEFLKYLSDINVTNQDGTWEMKGKADSAFSGTWDFNIAIFEERPAPPTPWRVWWWGEESSQGEIEVNRGRWELTPAGDNQTLLVLTLEAEVRGTPTFILRNFFLHRLKVVMRAVEKRLQSEAVK